MTKDKKKNGLVGKDKQNGRDEENMENGLVVKGKQNEKREESMKKDRIGKDRQNGKREESVKNDRMENGKQDGKGEESMENDRTGEDKQNRENEENIKKDDEIGKDQEEEKEKEVRTRFAPSPTGDLHVGSLRTALFAYLIAKKKGGKFLLRIEDTDKKREVAGSMEKIVQILNWAGISPDEGVLLSNDEERRTKSINANKNTNTDTDTNMNITNFSESYESEGEEDKNEEGKTKDTSVNANEENEGGAERGDVIIQKGKVGPYIQSERLKIYQNYILKLLANGSAYHCFCSAERLKKLREKQQQEGRPPMYDGHCCSLSEEEVAEMKKAGNDFVIRLRVPKDERIEFEDEVFGKISIDSNTVDDQVLIKSDGFPTYHFAVVVDDYLMKITHVTRGEEWLPSVPKHILLYRAFGWELPKFIHLPNVLGTDHKKLSKRQGDVSVEVFQEKGYLPEALINFLALLGWNPKSEREYFSLEELTKIFDSAGLHKAGAVFDYNKLDWMNAHYIKKLEVENLFELCRPYLEKYGADEILLRKIVAVEKERMKKLSEVAENIDFYFQPPKYDKKLLRWKEMTEEQVMQSLEKAKKTLEGMTEEDFNLEKLTEVLMTVAGEKRGEFLWPLRVALSGREKSPSPFEIAWVIGKKNALERLSKALE